MLWLLPISPRILPSYLINVQTSAAWVDQIRSAQQALIGKSADTCKKLYLDMAISLPFYGFTFFSVKVRTSPFPAFQTRCGTFLFLFLAFLIFFFFLFFSAHPTPRSWASTCPLSSIS